MSHHRRNNTLWQPRPPAEPSSKEYQRVALELGHAIQRLQARLADKQNAEAAQNSPRSENTPLR